jgi:hypothetical protein
MTLSEVRDKYHITTQIAWTFVAGVVALVVLVAAVIALPRTHTKTASSQSASTGDESGLTNTTSGSAGNVPGAGTAGIKSGGTVGGNTGSASSGAGGGTVYGAGGHNPAHVSSRFIPARGPGITDKYIYVGVGYSSQSAAGDRAIGGAGAAPSYDARDVFNSVVDYANNHGGFAGRRLKPLYRDFSLTEDFNTQWQSACAYWTQDNKVFAIGSGNDIINACVERAHAVGIGGGAGTTKTYKKYPHIVDPNGTASDRLGRVTVVGLHNAGYFGGKLGLVTWDDPTYREALKTGYIDTLTGYRIKPLAIAYITVPQQFQALGDMTAAVSSAVAKFKGLGIDHVMIQDGPAGVWSGDGLTFEWEQGAKSQRYYPRYGGNANNAPGFAVNPHDEEDHELAVDGSDNDKANDVGWHTNQTREKCFKIEADAGYPVSSSNTNDEGIAASVCDAVFFLQRVVNASSVLSNDEFVRITETLGKSFPSALIYGTYLFPGRHDGGNMVRTEEYLQSCSCLKYKGPPVYTG